MSTESEIKLQRYSQVEKEADDMGRVIGVRRLKPSEENKLNGMTADLVGYQEADIEIDGVITRKSMSHRVPLFLAASVCMIDDVRIMFPKTRGELDAMSDRLDKEGIVAAAKAIARLTKDDMEIQIVQKDEAKNLSGTLSSD
jgi:hypothetical protein